jgi:predicted metalloprotease
MAFVMDKDDVKEIVEATVTLTLARLGISPEEFLETKLDLAHLRSWRKANEKVRDYTVKAVITLVVTGFTAWLISALTGFKL